MSELGQACCEIGCRCLLDGFELLPKPIRRGCVGFTALIGIAMFVISLLAVFKVMYIPPCGIYVLGPVGCLFMIIGVGCVADKSGPCY